MGRPDEDRKSTGRTSLLFLPAAVFLCLGVVHLSLARAPTVFDAVVSFGPGASLALVALAIGRSELPAAHYRRLLGWCAAGSAGFGLVGLTLLLSPVVSISPPQVAVVTSLGLGTVAGYLAGFNEAQAIETGRELEQERAVAERAQTDRSRLEELNHLLRHDILNHVNVIEGHAALAREADGAEREASIHTIHRQSVAIADLIQNVRAYLVSTQSREALQPRNVSETLAAEVRTLESTFPESRVELDVPVDVYVLADDLLSSVFSNLLYNAVAHNRETNPSVSISMTLAADTATVHVRDDGPGLPRSIRESLFEPSERGDHGFGLYLVGTLVDRYGGTVTAETRDGEGTTFHVTLTRTDADE